MKDLVLLELTAAGILLMVLSRSGGAKEGAVSRRALTGLVLLLCSLLLGKMWIEVPAASVAALYNPLSGGIQPWR